MKFRVAPAIAAALMAAVVIGTGPIARAGDIPINPTLQKVIDGAKQEGKLTLSYAANILGGPEGARVGAAGIKKEFGVDIDVTYFPGPSFAPMAAKLLTEMQAGQPSSTDLYNGTAVEVTPQLSKGLFRKVPWTELYPSRITPQIAEADSRALRIVTKVPGILYNKRVAPKFAEATSIQDLLKPEFKGKLYTTPYLAGFDVLVAKDVWGYDKTEQFIKQFAQNIGGLVSCAGVDRIASGEIAALALSCSGSEAHLPKYGSVLGVAVMLDIACRRMRRIPMPRSSSRSTRRHPKAR